MGSSPVAVTYTETMIYKVFYVVSITYPVMMCYLKYATKTYPLGDEWEGCRRQTSTSDSRTLWKQLHAHLELPHTLTFSVLFMEKKKFLPAMKVTQTIQNHKD